MSDEKIDHAARARDLLEHPNLGAEAMAHATLALVEQQRIANLLAMASSEIGELISSGVGGLTERQPHPVYDTLMVPALRAEIREGLGL